MKKLSILILNFVFFLGLLTINKLIASEELFELPTIPQRLLILTDDALINSSQSEIEEIYPDSIRQETNEAFSLLQTAENPTTERNVYQGIRLLIKTAAQGEPYSLERLAYYALDGSYNLKKDVEWAWKALILLAQHQVTDAENVLTLMDENIMKLVKVGNFQEAKKAFDECMRKREKL